MSIVNIFIFLALILLIVVVFAAANSKKSGGWLTTVRPKPLMSSNEFAFFKLLRTVSAPLHVCPQVAMGAILDVVKGVESKERHGTRNRFAKKMVDFVLIDDDGEVMLIVELDDSSHSAAKDGKRDEMTDSAGYRTLRVRGADSRSEPMLRLRIAERLIVVEQNPATSASVVRMRPA